MIKTSLLFVAALLLAGGAAAQGYPARPVRFLVPFAPGGSVDLVARVVGAKAQEMLGQPFLVENRFGASEMLATDLLAKSASDGYTILLMTSTFAVNESLQASRPYDGAKDFAPVAKLVDLPFVLLVSPALPVRSVSELVSYAKANPGKLNYAHIGIGTPHHLILEWFKRVAGIDMTGIAYKSSGPGLTALATGEVHAIASGLSGTPPFIAAGKVRAIASASPSRIAAMPDLPTIAESGYPNFGLTSWFGVLTRAGTPAPAIEVLNSAMTKAVLLPDVRQKLSGLSLEPSPMASADFGRYIRKEIEVWGEIIKATGAKAE